MEAGYTATTTTGHYRPWSSSKRRRLHKSGSSARFRVLGSQQRWSNHGGSSGGGGAGAGAGGGGGDYGSGSGNEWKTMVPAFSAHPQPPSAPAPRPSQAPHAPPPPSGFGYLVPHAHPLRPNTAAAAASAAAASAASVKTAKSATTSTAATATATATAVLATSQSVKSNLNGGMAKSHQSTNTTTVVSGVSGVTGNSGVSAGATVPAASTSSSVRSDDVEMVPARTPVSAAFAAAASTTVVSAAASTAAAAVNTPRPSTATTTATAVLVMHNAPPPSSTAVVKPLPSFHSFVIYDSRKFTIDTRYVPKKQTGKGAYGCVVSCEDSETKKRVAIKKVAEPFDDLIDTRKLYREIRCMRRLDHDNIMKVIDLIEPSTRDGNIHAVYIVMPCMDINLTQCMDHNNNELTDEHHRYFAYQILKALKYLHSANILHRDLKPSNILVDSDCRVRLTDFGLARCATSDLSDSKTSAAAEAMTEYVVTRWYRAPEVLCSSGVYDGKMDVWSAGCILAEMLRRGKPLFPGENHMNQIRIIFEQLGTPSADTLKHICHKSAARDYIAKLPNFKRKDPATTWLQHIHKDAIDLVTRMLQVDPRQRISIEDALAHPYLASHRRKESETVAAVKFDPEEERTWPTHSRTEWTELFWKEILDMRPHARPKYDEWRRAVAARKRPQTAAATASAASAAATER